MDFDTKAKEIIEQAYRQRDSKGGEVATPEALTRLKQLLRECQPEKREVKGELNMTELHQTQGFNTAINEWAERLGL